jgi:uncharacterized protein
MKFLGIKIILPLAVVVLLLALFILYRMKNPGQTRVSEFGKYQGYSEPAYDGTARTSEYLTLSDGTRLAYDLVIPTKKGALADHPLPVLFKYTPYGRTWTIFDKNGKFLISDFVDLPTQVMARLRYLVMGDQGRIMGPLSRDKWLDPVVKHGYIILSVDRPGTGASFNSKTPGSLETAAKYENEIMNWIAAQSWSDGNIGMYGDSMQAMVQLLAASTGNPHLKAILPAASYMEMYDAVLYPGGVFDKAFINLYMKSTPMLDRLVTPVDSDPDGVLLAQALRERSVQNVMDMAMQCPFIDNTTPDGQSPWGILDPYPIVDSINQSHTAVYMTVGWYDVFTADMFYLYNSLSVPKQLTVRPTDHSQVSANLSDLNYSNEALRWLDYWLKGIDNGIMAEPPIHYYVQNGTKKGTWQTSVQWPLATQKLSPYYFGPGSTGSVASNNDGTLTLATPAVASASDAYKVDYTTTTGTKTRWGAVDETHNYPDMQKHDAGALTYTTPPLETDVVLTGHPLVHLWLSTSAPDLDVFVYLEQVDGNGHSTYITEGDLRASHRKLGQAPFNNLGLPYQTHKQSDLMPIPSDEPFEMVFSLLPSSYHFNAGSRIRITVAFADAGNFATPILDPAPTLQLLRDTSHPSYVELPISR